MISTYHATCGANTVMELDFAIDRTGNVDPAHAALYKAFGDWRRACYGSPIATTTLEPGASSVVLSLAGGAAGALMDRVVLQEAVAVGNYGQCVANYTLEVQLPSGEWLPFGVSGAHLIGNKRIELNAATPGANGPPVNATAVRFNVTAEWCASNVNVSAFSPVNCIPPPPPQTRVRYQYKDGRCLVTNLTLPCPGGISCPLFLGDCSLPAAVWNDGDGQSLSSPAAESQPNVVNADCNDCSAGTLFKLITGTGSPASLKFDAAAGRIAYGCGDRSLCLNGGQGAHSPPCNPNEPFRQDQILAAPCSDPDSNGWSRVPAESALPARQPPALAGPAPPPPAIVAAFAADGFVVESALSYGAGVGVSARSATALINNSMSHGYKPALWVRGSAYEMGFLIGALAEERVSEMTGTFLEHIVPALVSESLDEWLQNSTLAPVYDALCDALADLLVNDSARYFAASVAAGAIPPELVDEMKGVADGAVSANSTSTVTYEKLAAINFGYDMLLALIYTGEILDLLANKSIALGHDAAIAAAIAALPPAALRPPQLCNAVAARGAAVEGGGSLLLRDFMFALGEVFQYQVATIVYEPSDGRLPLVSVAAAGFVGSMVAMNSKGFAMGVDVLQAALGNTSVVGLNSLLMVRAATHASADTAAAIEFVEGAQRGVAWIYPMNDAGGNGAMLETAPTPPLASSDLPDFRPLVEDATLRALLPSPAEIAALLPAPLEYSRGVFVRRVGVHQRPEEQLIAAYNPQLFQHASRPYPPAAAWTSALGAVWPSFEAEEANFSASLGQHYFSPERNTDDDLGTYANRSPPIRLLTSPTSNRIREPATIWTAPRPIGLISAPPQFLRQTWPSRRRFESQQ